MFPVLGLTKICALLAACALLSSCALTPPSRPMSQDAPDNPDAPSAPNEPLNPTLVSETRTLLPLSAGADAQQIGSGMEHASHGETPMEHGRTKSSATMEPDHGQMEHSQHEKSPSLAATYTCPMHPEVTSASPGECPKCGMSLVRKSTP